MHTLEDIARLCGIGSGENTLADIACGLILQKRMEHPAYSHDTLIATVEQVTLAVRSGQAALYFDRFGAFSGYACWNRLNDEQQQRLLQGHGFPAHGGAGDHWWITDFRASRACLPYMLADLRDRMLAGAPAVAYFRHKRHKRIAKYMARNARLSFFRTPVPGA